MKTTVSTGFEILSIFDKTVALDPTDDGWAANMPAFYEIANTPNVCEVPLAAKGEFCRCSCIGPGL